MRRATELRDGGAWAERAETAGLDGVVRDAPHEELAARLALPADPAALPPAPRACWLGADQSVEEEWSGSWVGIKGEGGLVLCYATRRRLELARG